MSKPRKPAAKAKKKPAAHAKPTPKPVAPVVEAPQVPPAQEGDTVLAKPVAEPVIQHPTEEAARKDLEDNPARTSSLSEKGHIVRE